MWIRTYSKTFKDLKKQAVWKIWTDVNNWPKWHGDLDYCKLESQFAVGNHFMLKPKGVRAFRIELTEIVDGHKFTDCTSFFGAKMYNTHELEETPDGLKLTNTLVVTGLLSFLWVKLVAKNVADSVPEEMGALVEQARS